MVVRLAEQFKRTNIAQNIENNHLCVLEVIYLGAVIGRGGISTGPGKIESIVNWPATKSVKQIRGFLGLAGWYRRFIADFFDTFY